MQVGSDFGIIVDSFDTILSNQITSMQETFTDATAIDSPAYAIAYLQAKGLSVLQQALQTVWNTINADTAQGLGLDILANNIYNSLRLVKKSWMTVWVIATLPANTSGTLGLTTQLIFDTTIVTGTQPSYLLASSYSKSNTTNSSLSYSVRLTFVSTDTTTVIPANAVDIKTALNLNADTTGFTSLTIDTSQTTYSSAAVLGSIESDENFQLRRRSYLNSYGQTAQGMQKAITDLNIPALNAAYVQEYITNATRGFVIFIDYPTLIPNPPPSSTNSFDTSDSNLQLIAQTIYDFKPFGILSLGFNGAPTGDTLFKVTRNFSDNLAPDVSQNYYGNIYLNPMQYTLATMNLTLWVTLQASDTGINNAPFPSTKNNQALMKTELIILINKKVLF